MFLSKFLVRFSEFRVSKIKFKIISGVLLRLFFVFFTFQIQTLLFKSNYTFGGQFNIFSSVFLNFSEIFLWLAIISYGIHLLYGEKLVNRILNVQNFAVLFYFLISVISVFWSRDAVLSLFFVFKIFELILLYFLISEKILEKHTIVNCLIFGGVLQVLIGIGQYIKQGSLGLTFLGEVNLDVTSLNVARIDLAGEKLVRAYGTFPHANVFGGFLIFLLSIICFDFKKENLSKKVPIILILLIGLLISFSRTAWLAGIGFIVILFSQQSVKINWKYLFLGLIALVCGLILFNLHTVILARIVDLSGDSYLQRALFAEIAQNIFLNNPMGIGIGNFVLRMAEYSRLPLYPWLFQPVHNVFILVLVEMGVFGFAAYILLFFSSVRLCFSAMKRLLKMEKRQWKVWLACLFVVAILGMFDHYLYTIWAGQVMLFTLFGLINLSWQDRMKMDLAK